MNPQLRSGDMSDRCIWEEAAARVARPLLRATVEGGLRDAMPASPADRRRFMELAAFGRLLGGLSPWVDGLADEPQHPHHELHRLTLESIRVIADPNGPSPADFASPWQPLVDAALLAMAFRRAPRLFKSLDAQTQSRLIAGMRKTRSTRPVFSNWLLFSATVEAFFRDIGEKDFDLMRIDYAIRQHEAWYVGDGMYKDGPHFAFDYYNSFIIHPMLCELLDCVAGDDAFYAKLRDQAWLRLSRHASVLERLISPEGTIPIIGRSITYRFGALHALSFAAWKSRLDATLPPGQARSALTAVLLRFMNAPGNFDGSGFLTRGFAGDQPDLAEPYICAGSVYLFAFGFLPLGLATNDPFWSEPQQPWTSQRAYAGENIARDKSMH